ncbi:MAG: MFS transporter [Legionella sp.]|nr:MFS transporter [Legionella sp.]
MMKLLPFKVSALLLVASASFSSGIITAIFPILTDYYGVSAQKSSLLVSLFLFGYLSGQIFYGFLSKYKGYKYSLLIGFSILLCGDILQVCLIQGVDFSLFCLARFISAFGASSGLVCIFGIVNEIFAEEKENKKFLSLLFISLTLFAYFSILLGGIINFSFNWRFIFYFAVLISLIKIILVSRYIPSTKKTNILTTELRFLPILKTYIQAFRHQKLLASSLLIAFTTQPRLIPMPPWFQPYLQISSNYPL